MASILEDQDKAVAALLRSYLPQQSLAQQQPQGAQPAPVQSGTQGNNPFQFLNNPQLDPNFQELLTRAGDNIQRRTLSGARASNMPETGFTPRLDAAFGNLPPTLEGNFDTLQGQIRQNQGAQALADAEANAANSQAAAIEAQNALGALLLPPQRPASTDNPQRQVQGGNAETTGGLEQAPDPLGILPNSVGAVFQQAGTGLENTQPLNPDFQPTAVPPVTPMGVFTNNPNYNIPVDNTRQLIEQQAPQGLTAPQNAQVNTAPTGSTPPPLPLNIPTPVAQPPTQQLNDPFGPLPLNYFADMSPFGMASTFGGTQFEAAPNQMTRQQFLDPQFSVRPQTNNPNATPVGQRAQPRNLLEEGLQGYGPAFAIYDTFVKAFGG